MRRGSFILWGVYPGYSLRSNPGLISFAPVGLRFGFAVFADGHRGGAAAPPYRNQIREIRVRIPARDDARPTESVLHLCESVARNRFPFPRTSRRDCSQPNAE